jgi:hypothetical protein
MKAKDILAGVSVFAGSSWIYYALHASFWQLVGIGMLFGLGGAIFWIGE